MAEKLTIVIDGKSLTAQQAFDKVVGKMNKTEKKTKSLGASLKKMKGGFLAVAAAVAGAAIAFGKGIKAASDFEEANSKFLTTFRGVQEEANAMRKNLVDNFNVSSQAATELLSSTGDLLTGFGFSADAALDLSNEVNILAADLASFQNIDIKQAADAISKGLLGERESMKALGIAISEADVKGRIMLKGQENLTGAALRQARATATLELAMEASGNAIGDVARTNDSFANTMKRMKAIGQDLFLVFGQQFLKAINPMVKAFDKWIKSAEGIETIDVTIKSLITAFILLGAIVKVTFRIMQLNIKNITSVFLSLRNVIKKIFARDFKGAFDEAKKGIFDVKDNFVDGFDAIKNAGVDAALQIKDVWKQTNAAQVEGMNATKDNVFANQNEIVEKMALSLENITLITDEFNAATALTETEIMEKKIADLDNFLEAFAISKEQEDQINIASADLKNKLRDAELKASVGTMSKILSGATNLGNSISTLGGVQLENEKKKLAAIGDTNSAEFKAQEKRVKEAARKQANIDRRFGIFQAQLNIPIAVASAFATTPGGAIVKGFAAALAGAAAGINLAAVISKSVPSFQRGGNFTVPEGFPSDSFPISVESGESVSVTPTSESEGRDLDGGGGTTIIIENMTIQSDDPDDWAEKMEDFAISTGGRVKTR